MHGTPALNIAERLSETVTTEKQSTFSFIYQTAFPNLRSQNLIWYTRRPLWEYVWLPGKADHPPLHIQCDYVGNCSSPDERSPSSRVSDPTKGAILKPMQANSRIEVAGSWNFPRKIDEEEEEEVGSLIFKVGDLWVNRGGHIISSHSKPFCNSGIAHSASQFLKYINLLIFFIGFQFFTIN